MITRAFLLKDLKGNQTSYAPGDWLLIIKDGTLSGSAVTVNLSSDVRDGAVVHYFVFKPATLDSSGEFSAAAAVAGATDVAKVLILVDPKDLKMAGE